MSQFDICSELTPTEAADIHGGSNFVELSMAAGALAPDGPTPVRLVPSTNQALFSQYYTAFLGLAQWGDKPTYARSQSDAKLALSLVVQEPGPKLMDP